MKIRNFNITQFVATVTGCLAIIGFVWWLVQPRVDKKIEKETKDFVESRVYTDSLQKAINIEIRNYIDGATFQVKLQNYLASNQSNNVNVLALFADKMKVPEDEVAVKLGEMYTRDRPRLTNLLRVINDIYPERRVWTIVDE